MFEKITPDNVMMYAMKHYNNPQGDNEKEFLDDMKRFKYIKRLLRKYQDNGPLKERLILNHIIVLNNVFGADACSTLLLFKLFELFIQVFKFCSVDKLGLTNSSILSLKN